MLTEAFPDILHAADDRHTSKQRPHERTASLGAANDTQPWTAARCQRLLRQLQSRLEALRKLHFKGCVEPAGQTKRAGGTTEDSQRASKKIRYTYGQRRQSSRCKPEQSTPTTPTRSMRTLGAIKAGHESPASGHVVVPSPLWCKIRDRNDTLQIAPEEMLCPMIDATLSIPQKLLEQLAALKSSVPSIQFRIYEAIFHWVASLLRTTAPKPKDTSKKSLLGMCLRKVPACVADIEAWERRASKEKGNGSKWTSSSASADMYEQLEGFGSSATGWRPLKLVVLSHATYLLSEAIQDGLLEAPFAFVLGRLVLHFGRTEEAAALIRAASNKTQLAHVNGDAALKEDGGRALRVMVETTARTATSGNMLGCLTMLMQEQHLSGAWFASQGFKQSWLKGLEIMAAGDGGPGALDFLCTSMQLLSKTRSLGSDKNFHTLVSLASTVVAAAQAVRARDGREQSSQSNSGHRRLVYVLERSVRLARGRTRRRTPDSGAMILLLARQLALAGEHDATFQTIKQQAENELRTATTTQAPDEYDYAVRLACSVAQCRRRTRGVAGPEAVAEVCTMMDDIPSRGWSGQALRSDVAFLLAQKTKDLRDLAHAESLAATARETQDAPNTVFSGWRWEEGISEWVLSEDAPTSKSATVSASSKGSDDGRWSDEQRNNTARTRHSQNFGPNNARGRRSHDDNAASTTTYLRQQQHHDDRDKMHKKIGVLVSAPVNETRRNRLHRDDAVKRNNRSKQGGTDGSYSSPTNGLVARTRAATQQPAYGSWSDGKENELGRSGWRSISVSARRTGTGEIGQAQRKSVDWSRRRLSSIVPASHAPVVEDTDLDELS